MFTKDGSTTQVQAEGLGFTLDYSSVKGQFHGHSPGVSAKPCVCLVTGNADHALTIGTLDLTFACLLSTQRLK